VLRQNKIKIRHYAISKEGTQLYSSAQMAANAIKDAASNSEVSLNDITYLASASTLGDTLVPGLASHIHAELSLKPLEIANFQSVCASSLMAMKSSYALIKSNEHSCAAVVGSEFSSRYFRPGFYNGLNEVKEQNNIPFEADFLRFTLSDGAGAALLENRKNERQLSLKICWIDIRSYADRFDTCMVGGGARNGNSLHLWSDYDDLNMAINDGALILHQDFDLLKKIIPAWVNHYLDLIDLGKIKIDEISHFCSHYSSHSLREFTIDLLKKAGAMIDESIWYTNLYEKGNTGSASIFIILDDLYKSGKLTSRDKILCHVPESGRGLNGFMMLEVE
jgi:3-oxoacyl-[acyl-carrier-protein] synthase-3